MLRRKQLFQGLTIAFSIAVFVYLAFYLDLFYVLQRHSSDLLFRAGESRPVRGLPKEITVVAIDDKSLEQLGHFSTWPRSRYARLIDVLAEAKARVIVFDILFSEATADDEALALSMRNAGNVVLPSIIIPVVSNPAGLQPTGEPEAFLKPLAILANEAAAIGHATIIPDGDGVVRKLPIVLREGKSYEPALALAAVAEYLRRPEAIESPIEDGILPFAGRLIPLSHDKEMLINYISHPSASAGVDFPTVSLVDVLNGKADPAFFEDKLVFIGATATGITDIFWTPLSRMMNGVQIHASAAQTILTGDFLKPAPYLITVVSVFILALIVGLSILRLRVLWASLSAVALCLIYILAAFLFFDNGTLLNMFYPPLTIAGVFVGLNLYNIAQERAEKREITATFGRYISREVVDNILKASKEDGLKLGGQVHDITVAFADIRGFTSISEKILPEEMVKALNIYLSVIIEAVLNHGGLINKFGGDSVMAIWNVPTPSEGHALSAVKAAISAQKAIRELQAKDTTLSRMEFGIGINTGQAVAGNLGSKDRMEYSVIGDAVNTAARLANTTPGGKVWIGAETFREVKDAVIANPIEPLLVKGKREPVRAYEVVDITI